MSDNKRKIEHQIRFDWTTKLIFAAIAIGILVQAFGPALTIKSAMAEILQGTLTLNIIHSGAIL
jgi:hypothetical protein